MIDITDILSYRVTWITRSETEFIGEVSHVVRNNSGGGLNTPIGYLIGFIEPPSEYAGSYWNILLTVREEIRYNAQKNETKVFIKSAYANKLKYQIDKLKEFGRDIVRIDPKLPAAIHEKLIKNGSITSPLVIRTITGKDKYVFSNVEFSFD